MPINWLQISDLHVFQSTDLNLMIQGYKELAQVIHPDFLIVTGDFRHLKLNRSYDDALSFLNHLVSIFGLQKKDIFLVPGNHDVSNFEYRSEIISSIREKIDSNPDIYLNYLDNPTKDLRQAFYEYNEFVQSFYNHEITDERLSAPSDVMCLKWNNLLNIILLNTALTSDSSGVNSILDINKLSNISIDKSLPTIAIAHHDTDCLAESHQKRLHHILRSQNISAYICGDKHKVGKEIIEKVPNSSIPRIVCGKSVPETGDNYSDLSVIQYTWANDNNTYVQVYKYQNFKFVSSNDFYYEINKPYYFPMKISENKILINPQPKNPSRKISNNGVSIWLPDAEMAKGKQTRFTTYTSTEAIKKYLDNNAGYLGIISVKGIGKTFVLQVKRTQSSRKYICLPKCGKPSIKNNWATERISFDSYDAFKIPNIYDNLVRLWKLSIKCYVINQFKDINTDKSINDYVNTNRITSNISYVLSNTIFASLNSILNYFLTIEHWENEISKNQFGTTALCNLVLQNSDKSHSIQKDIAIFIDKIDQSIKQTNAEPPADCVLCKKRDNYHDCNSAQKCAEYCAQDDGCQSKNCCYGCEVFASANSNIGLRIYDDSVVSKYIHVSIWQYLQLALMDAAEQIYGEFSGKINVFYTIRQEALSCEEARLGEQNQKTSSKAIKLVYTRAEQEHIFKSCIDNQDPQFLVYPNYQAKEGFEEYAFVGVHNLCHPYCKNQDGTSKKETVFMSIYRHSFDRSRDIQRYGEELTQNIDEIKACTSEHEREETVKQIIENLAADLAYCSKQSESTVNPSYYTEKMRFLPNYWACNENFEKLLSLIDRNLLFEDDIINICKKINQCTQCPDSGCNNNICKRHPFSVLYKMGYLGYIMSNQNNTRNSTQVFLDASEVSYIVEKDALITAERVAYIIHPALTKTIEQKYNKSFMHFSGFILGKGNTASQSEIGKLLDDKKNLSPEDFILKYYYKP